MRGGRDPSADRGGVAAARRARDDRGRGAKAVRVGECGPRAADDGPGQSPCDRPQGRGEGALPGRELRHGQEGAGGLGRGPGIPVGTHPGSKDGALLLDRAAIKERFGELGFQNSNLGVALSATEKIAKISGVLKDDALKVNIPELEVLGEGIKQILSGSKK